jgi:hypothetical protein
MLRRKIENHFYLRWASGKQPHQRVVTVHFFPPEDLKFEPVTPEYLLFFSGKG